MKDRFSQDARGPRLDFRDYNPLPGRQVVDREVSEMRLLFVTFCLWGIWGWNRDTWSQEIAYFRHDGGVVREKDPLPDNFAEDAQQIWRTPLLPGNSSPCVCGQRVVVTTWDSAQKKLATVCLNRHDGNVLWTAEAPAQQIESFHPVSTPAAASAAADGQYWYLFFGSCGLLCYDWDGRQVWHHPMGPFQDEFGAASSPILVNDLIVLNEDHDLQSELIAFDRRTGEVIWRTPRDATRSYSTPVVRHHAGIQEILVAGSLQLSAYDPASGKRTWWVNGLSRILDSTPSVVGDRIYVASWTPGGDQADRITMLPFAEQLAQVDQNGDGSIGRDELPADSPLLDRFFRIDTNQNQSLDESEWNRHRTVFELAQNTAMAVTPRGQGDVTSESVQWVAKRGLPTVPSSVVYEQIMYMVKDGGILTSLDTATGQLLRQERLSGRGNYYASLIAGDGKLYACSESGEMTIVRAGDPFEILSSHPFNERVVATPVVSQGDIFLRTDQAMYCFRKKSN